MCAFTRRKFLNIMNSCQFFGQRRLPCLAFVFLSVSLLFSNPLSAKSHRKHAPQQGVTFTVVVSDSANSQPLSFARVALYRGSALIRGQVTNPEGRAVFTDVVAGNYKLVVHYVGYNDFVDNIIVDTSHTFDAVILTETTEQVTVTGFQEPAITTVDPTSGNQIFEGETYHAPPTARMTQLVQENLMGAARAPTGEVHIRGQHGEYTFYLDGAPIPLGVFGGLNEVVDPHVIDRATFVDGGWPAEYGGQIAAVIDMQTHVPSGGFHLDASAYAGTYAPSQSKDSVIQPNHLLNMNGQSRKIRMVPFRLAPGNRPPYRSAHPNDFPRSRIRLFPLWQS
jgi:hypothetical protein